MFGIFKKKIRTVPITHLNKPGHLACDRLVECGDYREGEAIANVGSLTSCVQCRKKLFNGDLA